MAEMLNLVQPTKLALVQKTEFEELAAKIEAENKAENKERDCHVKCLEKIMLAYSYIRCVLESRPRNLTPKEVATIFNFINSVILPKKQKAEKESEAKMYVSFCMESWCVNSYTWFQYSIFKDCHGWMFSNKDEHRWINKSSSWKNYQKSNPKSERTLKTGRLEEDLWDYEKSVFRYDKLPQFIKNYPWAFPPNVVELHKETIKAWRKQNVRE